MREHTNEKTLTEKLTGYRSYEVEGCRFADDGQNITVEHDPYLFEFFTVYGRDEQGLATALLNFATEIKAIETKLALDALNLFRTFLPNFSYEFLVDDVVSHVSELADTVSPKKSDR